MSGSRTGIQADFNCGWLRHGKLLRPALSTIETLKFVFLMEITALSTVSPIFMRKFLNRKHAGGL
tara:strand:- start:180 stop:374 length:195 start_codon:yes stop_codon:yes gene_type:complete